jgi:hypothetical protein
METNALLALSLSPNNVGKSRVSFFLMVIFLSYLLNFLAFAQALERTEFLLQNYNAQVTMVDQAASVFLQSVQHLVELAPSFDLVGRDFPRQTPDDVFDAISSLVSIVDTPSFGDRFRQTVDQYKAFNEPLRGLPISSSIAFSPQDVHMRDVLSRHASPDYFVPGGLPIRMPSEFPKGPVSPGLRERPSKRARAGSTPTFSPPLTGDLDRIPEVTETSSPVSTRRRNKRSSVVVPSLSTIPSGSSQDVVEGGSVGGVSGSVPAPFFSVFPSQPPPRRVLRDLPRDKSGK